MPDRSASGFVVVIAALYVLAGCADSRSADSSLDKPTIDIGGQTYFIASLDEVDDLLRAQPQAAGAWPKAGQLSIKLTLAQPKTGKYRRPYVAVWIEDSTSTPVRFLTLWGKQPKYQRDLRDFWVYTKRNTKEVDAVTGPTRAAGSYNLVWDGLDDAGKPLPAGDYTVHIEVVREHGTRVHMKSTLACGGTVKDDKLEGNLEVESVAIHFGPAAAPVLKP